MVRLPSGPLICCMKKIIAIFLFGGSFILLWFAWTIYYTAYYIVNANQKPIDILILVLSSTLSGFIGYKFLRS